MYLEFFGLREQPFGVTPDPAFLYLSHTHRQALEALRADLMNDRGFLALVGDPGLGKTTLLYKLLDEWRTSSRVIFLFQTQCDSRDLFEYLLAELGIDADGMSHVAMHHKLNQILFQEMLAGRRFVLIIDEAQNLDDKVLETIRLLSNFETPHAKLLNIVLAGQPQLADKLSTPGLRQLRQRIGLVCRLRPLTLKETGEYIAHRLALAGYGGAPIFSETVIQAIDAVSQGAPRVINNICHQILCEAAMELQRSVDLDMALNVIATIEGRSIELHLDEDGVDAAKHEEAEKVPAEVIAQHEQEDVAAEPVIEESARIEPATVESVPVAVAEIAPVETPVAADAAIAEAEVAVAESVSSVMERAGAESVPAASTPAEKPEPAPLPVRSFVPERRPQSPMASSMLLSYGAPPKAKSKRWKIGTVASCILVLAGALAFTAQPVRRLVKRQFTYLTSSVWGSAVASASDSGVAPAPAGDPSSALDSALVDSRFGQVITVAAKDGQTVEDLSRVYVGRFDQELYRQIYELNPELKNPDYLEAGELIRLPLPAGTLKKVLDTGEASPSGKWQNAIGKFKGFFSSSKQ